MAWICLAESEDSALHYPTGLDQSRTVKTTDTLNRSYFLGCLIEQLRERRSGTMSEPCYLDIFQKSTLFMEASHAKTLVLQAMEKAWQESEADYFSRSLDLSKILNLPSYSLKMYPLSELVDLMQSLKKLPMQGMIVGGQIYPLRKLERHIKEIDGGYWATPNTMDSLPLRSEEALKRQFLTTRKGRTKPANLREQVHPQCYPKVLFPTPDASIRGPAKTYDPTAKSQSGRTLQSYVKQFPTPAARDWKDNGKSPAELSRNSETLASIAGGQLSPMWVEWLMGYRIGWTELSASVMPWFLSARKKRLKN